MNQLASVRKNQNLNIINLSINQSRYADIEKKELF